MNFNEFFNGAGPANNNYALFELAHILWFAIPLVLIIVMCVLFRKYQKAGKVFLYIFASIMLALRITKYGIIKPFVWENNWIESIPFSLCTILSYILPFVVIFNFKKAMPYLYPLAILGGIITMAYPDWIFNGRGLNFNKLESLIVHILLIAIPFVSISVKRYQLKLTNFYKPVIALTIVTAYAHIANKFITPGTNHMFLESNPLPIDFGGLNHVIVFSVAMILVLFLMHIPGSFQKKSVEKGRPLTTQTKNENKNRKNKNKNK